MYNIIATNLEFDKNELVSFNIKTMREATLTAASMAASSKTHTNFKVRKEYD